ncbi:MAG: DUF4412 domain-containing protein [Bacteroidales bacterium]
MKHWLKILIFIIIVPIKVFSNAGMFEGKIKIIKEGIYDTLQIEISVKNDIVRIDEINSKNAITRSFLVNLSKEKIYALSVKDKLYTEIPLKSLANTNNDSEFIKTKNFMKINGEVCQQWRIRNKKRNTELTYWVAEKNYNFMKSLVGILQRSETPLGIFSQFPQVNGFFPLFTVERTLFRKVKESTRIIEIKSQKLPDKMFVIPPGYRELLG